MIAASSQTALTAAAARAAHLIVDRPPWIFADTLALPLLGSQGSDLVGYHRAHGSHPVLAGARGQVICRGRYAEDALATAIGDGVRQYLILGAGLDTFAYRSDLARHVRVFEVDHPGSQESKRGLLSAAGIQTPDNVTFVPFDFEAETLADALATFGFDTATLAFVSWLGVTMYLTEAAIGETLAEIGRLAPGTEIVADYMLPEHLRDEAGSAYVAQVAPVAAEHGEPWLTFLAPARMSTLLARGGCTPIRHVRQHEIGDAMIWKRSDSLRPVALSAIAHAIVVGKPAAADRLAMKTLVPSGLTASAAAKSFLLRGPMKRAAHNCLPEAPAWATVAQSRVRGDGMSGNAAVRAGPQGRARHGHAHGRSGQGR